MIQGSFNSLICKFPPSGPQFFQRLSRAKTGWIEGRNRCGVGAKMATPIFSDTLGNLTPEALQNGRPRLHSLEGPAFLGSKRTSFRSMSEQIGVASTYANRHLFFLCSGPKTKANLRKTALRPRLRSYGLCPTSGKLRQPFKPAAGFTLSKLGTELGPICESLSLSLAPATADDRVSVAGLNLG